MAFVRRGIGDDDSDIESVSLSREIFSVVRWMAIPCVAVFFASWSVAALVSLHSAASRTVDASFLAAALPAPPVTSSKAAAQPTRTQFVRVTNKTKTARLDRPPVRLARIGKPVAEAPVDPFGEIVAEAKLTREKFITAFASAGMVISGPRAADTVRLASAMPSAERFQRHALSQAEQPDDTVANAAPASLGPNGAEIQLAYASVETGWDNPVDLAIATLADDPADLDSDIDAATDAMPDSVELPAERPVERLVEKPGAKLAAKPASREPAVAQKPAAPARKPTSSNRQEQQTLAYARPDKPSIGAFKNLFNTPKAGNGVAIYDISAAVVHMPDGTRLEAHSGIGKMADNPRYVHVKMNGPTPPNTYRLSMREKRFHGVEAVRMTPIGDETMHGRNGILAHSYLLRGGRAESHGCVAFKDYQRFLKAFKQGKVTHIVVVPSMSKTPKVRLASAGRGT